MAWSNINNNITATQIVKSEPCAAVVGAISSKRGAVLNYIKAKSIKSVDFVDFLDRLKEVTL